MKYDIIFAQVGTPKSSSPDDIKTFLKDFLGSKRVVNANKYIWGIILNLIILPRRPKKVSERYVEMEKILGGNPAIINTKKIEYQLNKIKIDNIKLHLCSALESDSIRKLNSDLSKDSKKFIVPMYPQYSEATYQLIFDQLRTIENGIMISTFYALDEFSKHSVQQINDYLIKVDHKIDCLLLSFHSYPISRIETGDSYGKEVIETFYKIKSKINKNITLNTKIKDIKLCYQSKFGKGIWLDPLVEDQLCELKKSGKKNIAIYSPSFMIDTIETSWEIGIDLKRKAKSMGMNLFFIESLNSNKDWIECFVSKTVNSLIKSNN